MTDKQPRKKSKHKRRRLLGSGLSTSEKFNALGRYQKGEFFQLIYCMMQAHADEWGIIPANNFGFKALVLPGSSRKEEMFTQSLQAMHEVGLGTLYIFSNKPYFEIWDFDGAQSGWIREDRRTPGVVPRYSPDNNDLEILPGITRNCPEEPGNTVKTLPYSTLPKDTHGASSGNFDKFWNAYPRKKGKAKAKSSWTKTRGVPIETILEALEKDKKTDQWQRGIIPNPTTWLNEKRWEDEHQDQQPKTITLSDAKAELRHDSFYYESEVERRCSKLSTEDAEKLKEWARERWPEEKLEEITDPEREAAAAEIRKAIDEIGGKA
ncbi:MAG TPA: hypothetical protein ENH62_17140 [Marinobacter sp.]|uniref:Uncharacterized protein n=1 Tax=marine sediment metagenome TaxID=412755 RepID=A0A0F9QB88_9ZZZZ|nr:hypothetical protein [Marinobacter sp.]